MTEKELTIQELERAIGGRRPGHAAQAGHGMEPAAAQGTRTSDVRGGNFEPLSDPR